jgi:asparagine synthase (glutamine-hydrolysing)
MCGIVGIIGTGASGEKRDAMLAAQRHRGPDATGRYLDGHAALGHNRLSIIDLNACSNQPFSDASGRYQMVFNGEIYNYIELRDALPGYDFKTQSDTEVLLAAYLKWGKDCLDRLNGMFAFAIWDSVSQSLFAARDRFGVKPFHYAFWDGHFYFASEIKAFFAAGIAKKPNENVWASYLAYGSYGEPEETFWDGISQLAGGHWLTYSGGAVHMEKWYDFVSAVQCQPRDLTYDQSKAHYLALLKDSIRLRFRADVPVGFNISGGLDSSVLLAMVDDFTGHDANIAAYTFYTGNPQYDELPWVEMMLEHTGNPLHKVLLGAGEVAQLSRKISAHEDEPYGGIPTLAYAKVFERARQNGTVVLLDGQGMDEQWAGYDYYTKGHGATIQGVSQSPYRPGVLSPGFLAKARAPVYPVPFADALQNLQYRDLFYTKIPRALRFNDRISMAYTTELREPFLDYRLVEFAFSRPENHKIKDGVTKAVLRDIASEYLSDGLAFAPKRPLQTPQREWLADELRPFVENALSAIRESRIENWFDQDALHAEWRRYLDGDNDSSFHIWQWLSVAAAW